MPKTFVPLKPEHPDAAGNHPLEEVHAHNAFVLDMLVNLAPDREKIALVMRYHDAWLKWSLLAQTLERLLSSNSLNHMATMLSDLQRRATQQHTRYMAATSELELFFDLLKPKETPECPDNTKESETPWRPKAKT
jgi:hypothetical protein